MESHSVSQFLIDQESTWELFLRRAGFNCYAAQVVMGMLKSSRTDGELSKEGPAIFIRMSQQERVAAFKEMMGGRRVLDRVDQALKTPFE